MKLILVLFVLHIILLVSMFDVYFQTSVIEGIQVVQNDLTSKAKRLVLFVGDGLRCDTFFGSDSNFQYTPYLRTLIRNGAPWGVSHTRVPTESRPGHVAIIAGFYEDPSAVFKGWKENPVPFDSVFNQSRATFSWGSPDIVPLFNNELSSHNIYWYSYSHEEQDFSGKNGTVFYLNSWVYENFKKVIELSQTNVTLYNILNQERIVLFFHFLGIDVAGHTRKPNSDYYKSAINHTDKMIENIVDLIESFYNDGNTAYIFTSDHGMTDWGSHGAGSESETLTPLVAWGAGVKQSNCKDNVPPNYHQSPCNMKVNQADIAVLMSILLGSAIPVQSTGVLPVDYMDLDEKGQTLALLLNARQLLNQFIKKEYDVKSSIPSFFYVPYIELQKDVQAYRLNKINDLIEESNFLEATKGVRYLINEALNGIAYYQRYFQRIKLFLLYITFIGVICLILTEILSYSVHGSEGKGLYWPINEARQTSNLKESTYWIFAIIILLLIFAGLFTLPAIFIFYMILPIPVWFYVLFKNKWFNASYRRTLHIVNSNSWIPNVFLYLCGVQLIFWSFFYRWIVSLLMLTIMLWLFIGDNIKSHLRVFWITSSILVAIFPLLPTVGSEPQILFVLISALIWCSVGVIWTVFSLKIRVAVDYYLITKGVVIILTIINMLIIDSSYYSGAGLPKINQAMSYFSLGFYFTLMFFGPNTIIPRFISICVSLGMIFLLFSSAVESFFPIVLAFNLGVWINIEMARINSDREISFSPITEPGRARKLIYPDDLRRSFFYLSYMVISFFGIGNIDSLNSFDLAWIKGFITVFSPFLMTTLVLLKTIMPFIMVACAFRIIVLKSHAEVHRLFLIVLLFCDILGLQFLFFVRNEGSWLDIGKSISHFVIVEVTTLFLIILYGLTKLIIPSTGSIDLSFPKFRID